jgi:hypothetical protein
MSREMERLEDQLRRSFEGDAWHGPAVLEVLAGVDAGQAAARPIADGHCIWELVLHLAGTYRLVLRRLGGDGAQLLPRTTGLRCQRSLQRTGATPWRCCVS